MFGDRTWTLLYMIDAHPPNAPLRKSCLVSMRSMEATTRFVVNAICVSTPFRSDCRLYCLVVERHVEAEQVAVKTMMNTTSVTREELLQQPTIIVSIFVNRDGVEYTYIDCQRVLAL